jgi:hypothetical protein
VFAVNVVAPCVVTALIEKPGRLVYLSSDINRRAGARMEDLTRLKRRWDGDEAYAESKLYDVLLHRCRRLALAKVYFRAPWKPGWVAARGRRMTTPEHR